MKPNSQRSLRLMTALGLIATSTLVLLAAPANAGPNACVDDFRSDTGYFAGVAVTQIIQNEPTDPSSYVSDAGYFAGQELQVAGRFVDCATN